MLLLGNVAVGKFFTISPKNFIQQMYGENLSSTRNNYAQTC